MNRLLAIFGLLCCCLRLQAAEVIPPAPEHYFNDYAHAVSSATADRLNRQLEDFEKQTSSQIVVAIYPKMQSDSSIEEYTVRVARAWKVGQNEKNNGAVLFVFVQDHKMFIQVGYGLEGALPDATCWQIINNEISPRLKQGDFDGGLSAGVSAMLAATKGEYKGTGHTVNGSRGGSQSLPSRHWLLILVIIVIFIALSSGRRRPGFWSGWMLGSSGFGGWGSGGGGGWSGGGGGGGGFSGGGGSFGGGGAGGSW